MGTVETLHDYWKAKIEDLSRLNKDKLRWEIKQLNKALNGRSSIDDTTDGVADTNKKNDQQAKMDRPADTE